MEFKLDTPENLDSMSRQELLDATIETVPCLFNKEKRLQIIENLYREFGLQLSNDIRYALLTETERLLIIALAGAGKTTNTVMKVILEQYFNKDLRADNFLFIVYNKDNVGDIERIYNDLCNKLYDIGKGEEDIVVSYRNNDSIDIIREIFIREDIPFHTGKNEEPFSFYLYRNTLKILEACYMPHIVQNQLNLYMVLPFSKADIHALLEYDEKTGIFNAPPHRITELPIEKIAKSVKTANAYKKFCTIAEKVKTEPMNTYMSELLDMLIANYYMPNKSANHDFLVSMVRSYFNSDLPFSQFYVEHSKKYSKMLLWQQTRRGVRLSTFHTLKGLGFNEVFLMDLDNDIFPNENRLEIQDLSEKEKLARADESNRLFYVAVTRTKKNLHMYFNKENPSRYIELMDEKIIGKPTEKSQQKRDIKKEVIKEVIYKKEDSLDDEDLFGVSGGSFRVDEDLFTNEDLSTNLTDEDLFVDNIKESDFTVIDNFSTDSITDEDLFTSEDLFITKEEVMNEQTMEEPIITKKTWRSTKLKDRFRR